MSRKLWLLLAVAALLAASFAASVVAAKRSSETRVKYVTRGLDYLHARQGDNGGFGSAENTAMAVMGAVASGERMGHSAWHVKGKNPYDYLQSTDLVAASTSIDVSNAPVFYSRLIMSYVAMDRAGTIGTAGSKGVNLWTLLLSYQNTPTGPPGAFAPSLPSLDSAVRTTSWAILAMNNGGLSHSDPNYRLPRQWLAAQQNDRRRHGGFPASEQGGASDCPRHGPCLPGAHRQLGRHRTGTQASRCRTSRPARRRAAASHPRRAGTRMPRRPPPPIQMILVEGGNPDGSDWRVGVNTPITALHHLLETNGSYKSSASSHLRPVIVTSWVLVALNHKPFTTYPRNPGAAHKAFRFRPIFHTISPKNGAKFKTHIVLIRATYTDFFPKGTGIKPSACRLYVDDQNRSKPADIGKYGLHLELKNVANGDHKYRIELRDQAGNGKVVERKFTVAVPTPTPTHTPTDPADVYPACVSHAHGDDQAVHADATPRRRRISRSRRTRTRRARRRRPVPVVTGSPVPSPSTSASPAGAGAEGGGGSAAGFVGGTLLAMLPIGAAISYLLLHRREEALDTASQGAVLAGGGSAWERFKHTLARSKDLTRPSSRG